MKLVTEMLDEAAAMYPDKVAFTDPNGTITYAQLRSTSRKIAAAIYNLGFMHSPVVIYLPNSIECIASMLGVVYSGNFYCVADVEMPKPRLDKIIEIMEPAAVITTQERLEEARKMFGDTANYIVYESTRSLEADDAVLEDIRKQIDPNEIMFLLFTSGSTGVPKGVIISHRAEFHHLTWVGDFFGLDENTILLNQAPMYFIMSVFDIYQTILRKGHCHIVPPSYFAFPILLLNYLKEHHVNAMNVVPSALAVAANYHAVSEVHLDDLKLVFFGGEVLPVKQLNVWLREYPDVTFADVYGATEVADTLTYYIVPGELDESETVPIGLTAGHMKTMILDENNQPVPVGEVGELCVTGPSLADGYYKDPERTAEVFVPNPLYKEGDPWYMKRMYRMGDLVKMREDGNMLYIGRKDFQIKHMGHRIELGEIETAVSSLEGIGQNCCLHDKERDQIILIYTGTLDDETTIIKLRDLLPDYMVPTEIYQLDKMPLTPNGKIDRQRLRKEYIG